MLISKFKEHFCNVCWNVLIIRSVKPDNFLFLLMFLLVVGGDSFLKRVSFIITLIKCNFVLVFWLIKYYLTRYLLFILLKTISPSSLNKPITFLFNMPCQIVCKFKLIEKVHLHCSCPLAHQSNYCFPFFSKFFLQGVIVIFGYNW